MSGAPLLERPAAAASALEAIGLRKAYASPDGRRIQAVDDVSLRVSPGSMTAIMGPSGSGKSTLLNLLAGLDRPDAGRILIGGTEITRLRDRALTRLRRTHVGFIFQSFNLLPQLTARQNIVLPLELARRRPEPGEIERIAESLGILERLDHRPAELSGGQQQRVAIARALLPRPDLIVADEPTGALDSVTGAELLQTLRDTVDRQGRAVLLVTHDDRAASYADTVLTMRDGKLA